MAVSKSLKTSEKFNKSKFHIIIGLLSTTFFTIWIIIGLLVLLFIYANFKQGAFSGLLSGSPAGQQVPPTAQVPTETDLPGIGTVNIECVQNSLTEETIQKLITDGPASLTDEENSTLEPCIVKPELSEGPGN